MVYVALSRYVMLLRNFNIPAYETAHYFSNDLYSKV